MSLKILTSSPSHNEIAVPIDSGVQLSFSNNLEKFSIPNGISVYSIGAQTWTGQLMSTMDSATSDVKSSADQINLVEYSYEVSGGNITIKPSSHLSQKTKYYIQIAPGNDPTRFLTSSTYDDPSYLLNNQDNDASVEIVSPYIGKENCIYKLTFNDHESFDLSVNDIYTDTYTFKQGEEFKLNKKISISINGIFESGDTALLNLYAPIGQSELTKLTFITSDYTESIVKSTNIEDKLYKTLLDEFKIISTIPASMSVNNSRINPIIIKFNKDIDSSIIPDILDKVRIFKLNLDTGSTRRIVFYPQITGPLLKLYLVSVDGMSEVSELPLYEIAEDALSIGTDYTLIAQSASFKTY